MIENQLSNPTLDEKVVDQWQVAYRGELSGSTAGQSVFNYYVAGFTVSENYEYAIDTFVNNSLIARNHSFIAYNN